MHGVGPAPCCSHSDIGLLRRMTVKNGDASCTGEQDKHDYSRNFGHLRRWVLHLWSPAPFRTTSGISCVLHENNIILFIFAVISEYGRILQEDSDNIL